MFCVLSKELLIWKDKFKVNIDFHKAFLENQKEESEGIPVLEQKNRNACLVAIKKKPWNINEYEWIFPFIKNYNNIYFIT